MIKGIIFDFDGLILDTETPDFLAWSEIYKSHNLDLKLSDWSRGVGARFDSLDLSSILEQQLGIPLDKTRIRDEHKSLSLNLILKESILPGVQDKIIRARDLGFKIAIASSSDEKWVKSHLKRLQIENDFNYVCTIDQVKNGKPDPDLYLLALKHLELEPREAIAFEDSPNGIKAAKAANLFCVAVGNKMTSQMDLSQADIILTSLGNISLEQILDFSLSANILD